MHLYTVYYYLYMYVCVCDGEITAIYLYTTNSFSPIENDVTQMCFIDTVDSPNSDTLAM